MRANAVLRLPFGAGSLNSDPNDVQGCERPPGKLGSALNDQTPHQFAESTVGARRPGTSYDVSPDAGRVYFPHPGAPSKPRDLGFALERAARLK